MCLHILYRRQVHGFSHSGCASKTSEEIVLVNEFGCWLRGQQMQSERRDRLEWNPVRGTRGRSESVSGPDGGDLTQQIRRQVSAVQRSQEIDTNRNYLENGRQQHTSKIGSAPDEQCINRLCVNTVCRLVSGWVLSLSWMNYEPEWPAPTHRGPWLLQCDQGWAWSAIASRCRISGVWHHKWESPLTCMMDRSAYLVATVRWVGC